MRHPIAAIGLALMAVLPPAFTTARDMPALSPARAGLSDAGFQTLVYQAIAE